MESSAQPDTGAGSSAAVVAAPAIPTPQNTGNANVIAYADLLAKAHGIGLKKVRTRIVQVPSVNNGQLAVVTASIITHKGTFTGIGDASPGNVDDQFAPHLLRVAETRAKARAMRDALGIAAVAEEELPGPRPASPMLKLVSGNGNAGKLTAANDDSEGNGSVHTSRPAPITEKQRRTLFRLMAKAGKEGDEAKAALKELLAVEELREATSAQTESVIAKLTAGNGSAGPATVPESRHA